MANKNPNPFKKFKKKDVKDAIERHELFVSGNKWTNGAYTIADKIQFMTGEELHDEGLDTEKDIPEEMYSAWFVVYDITIGNDMDKKQEFYRDCFLPYSFFKSMEAK